MNIYIYTYIYIYIIYIYTNLPVDVIVRLLHPRSGGVEIARARKRF